MVEQRDEAWVKAASPEQINAAMGAGELAQYLGGKTEEEKAHDAHVGAPQIASLPRRTVSLRSRR
ncbi:hypothetical protein ACRAWB_01885 [Leifsonia poae]|uniref:hypothetical protein n=1 Tax=Leifsonia poae TaxID=110933 RepID=UPI003D690FD5